MSWLGNMNYRYILISSIFLGLLNTGCNPSNNDRSLDSSMVEGVQDDVGTLPIYSGRWNSDCMYVSNEESDIYLKITMNIEQDILERRIWGFSDSECTELSDEYSSTPKAYGKVSVLSGASTSTQLGDAQHVDIAWFLYTWNINEELVEIENYFEGYEPTKDIWIVQGEYMYFGMGLYLDEEEMDRPTTLQSFSLRKQ